VYVLFGVLTVEDDDNGLLYVLVGAMIFIFGYMVGNLASRYQAI
jgi:hypothetical protein